MFTLPSLMLTANRKVLRQGSFINKMVDLGWTAHDRFTGSAHEWNSVQVLVRCIARYHAFLDLMSTSVTFFVPTIVSTQDSHFSHCNSLNTTQDIDLSWHTHQLKSKSYREQTSEYVGRTPDHDDKVEENALSTGYEITAKAWKSRFGVPYSVCGCGPTSSGLFGMLSRFFRRVCRICGTSEGSNEGVARPDNLRPDLVSVDDEDADATHPSEHNSVVVVQHAASKHARRVREKKIQKREKVRAKVAEKGQYKNEWERLKYERSSRSKHDEAFLAPVPYWGM